jgi:hypothetical protein
MANENEPRNDETPEQPEGADESRGLLDNILGRDKEQPGAARIQGKVALEELEQLPGDMRLTAYAFDNRGQLIGRGPINAEGGFDVPVRLTQPADVEVVIGPADEDVQKVREGDTYSQMYAANEWQRTERGFVLRPDLYLLRPIWWPWLPVRVCVSGHVRKVEAGHAPCPVPLAKVEIFDVDREACWWPFISRWWDLLRDRLVVHIPDLVRERPFPIPPGPDPDPIGPIARLRDVAQAAPRMINIGAEHGFDPQPEPPAFKAFNVGRLPKLAHKFVHPLDIVAFNPQPDPPREVGEMADTMALGEAQMLNPQPLPPKVDLERQGKYVGEMRTLQATVARQFENLTLNAKIAPWVLFPRCFYSRQLICTVYTDCNGFFRCCFRWFPWHIRHGRLRYDSRPDIIIRVTQTINGQDHVIYLDPYTSTRWNRTNAHIDLYLDDPDILCGPGCEPGDPLPAGTVALTKVASDPVWHINKANGKYQVPPVSNAAYGGTISIYANFSHDLQNGSPVRYYRLSYAKAGTTTFTAIDTPLSDYRASITVPPHNFHPHVLGPQPSGPTAGMYEVRDRQNYFWLEAGLGGGGRIGIWDTTKAELDEGAYILRLEMFDAAGNPLTTVQYQDHAGDGSGNPPAVPPVVAGRYDIRVYLDNKPLEFGLTTPASNECGVIAWPPPNPLNFHVDAEQENGRVNSWILEYVKGINPTRHTLGSATYNAGTSPVSVDVNGNAMVAGLTSTCAFALLLRAWSHVRGDSGFHYYGEKAYAIAIERCICPPTPVLARAAAQPEHQD